MTKTIRTNEEIERTILWITRHCPHIKKQSEVCTFAYSMAAADIAASKSESAPKLDWKKAMAVRITYDDQEEIDYAETRSISVNSEDYQLVVDDYLSLPQVRRVSFAFLTRLVLILTRLRLEQAEAPPIRAVESQQGEMMMWVGRLFEQNTPRAQETIRILEQMKREWEENHELS